MHMPNVVQNRMVMSEFRRITNGMYIGIMAFSASHVGATLYVDPENSDVSNYWIVEPCCTAISVPWEINSEFQLIEQDDVLRDGSIPDPDLHDMQQLNLIDTGAEIQAIGVSIHGGDVQLVGSSSATIAGGSIQVAALENTPVEFDGLASGGTIVVTGASIDSVAPVVPEPSTMALLVIGVMGMMGLHRRR